MNDILKKIQAEAHRLEWNAIYTSKGHYNAAMLWNLTHYTLGIAAVIFGAFAGKEFAGLNPNIATFMASCSAALAAIITLLKPSEKAGPHHQSGVRISSLLNRLRFFQNITAANASDSKELSEELKGLSEDYNGLTETAPPIPWLAYQLTRRGVRKGEHKYDEEDER